MTTHKIILSAPGTGTVADLLRATQTSSAAYIYWNLSDYDNHAVGSLPFLYDGTIDEQLQTASTITIIFDEIEVLDVLSLNMLIGRLRTWTSLNGDKPITVYWPVRVVDPERAKELIGDLLPLTTFNLNGELKALGSEGSS